VAADLKTLLASRWNAVDARIRAACHRSGRAREDVTLVAVTKSVSAHVAAALHELGAVHLGENRPQELWRKAAALPASVVWHMIGHLQRNKIERTLPLVSWIHSVDSVRLLEALEREASKGGRPVRVLLEVNASREASKQGFSPEDLPGVLPGLNGLQYARVSGLMTMAAFEEDPERCRPTFRQLRELRDRLAVLVQPPRELRELSMGMTNDFEVAVEEGATFVRVGSALFEGLPEEDA
jgi:pyridoxal phosphate enzyme (YggS family)